MQRHFMRISMVAMSVFLSVAAAAQAVVISTTRVDHVSSELTTSFNRDAVMTVNGSGLNIVTGTHSVTPDGTMWLSTSTSNCCGGLTYQGNVLSNVDANPEITYDLGAEFNINTMRVWNYNEGVPNLTNRGVRQANLLVSSDNVNYTNLGLVTLNQAPGSAAVDFSQIVNVGTTGRFVKLDIVNNHGDGNGFVGLSEVRFEGDALEAKFQKLATGVTATASSSLTGGPFDRDASHVVDGSGFNLVTGTHSNGLEGVHWLNRGSSGAFGTPDLAPQITFDLGGLLEVSEVQIWNYNEANASRARGVNDMTVEVSSDGISFTTLFSTNLFAAPGEATFDYHQTLVLDTLARFVRFSGLTNHGGDNGFVGLSEVRFFHTTVPEPASLGLIGLAAMALGSRRRRAA